MTTQNPLISVVVTSYSMERLKDIEDLLDSLCRQGYQNLQIIFVGEGTPDLCAAVEKYRRQRNITNLEMVFNDGLRGLAPARNLGIRYAKGELIAFLDDDAIAFPDWAEKLVKAFSVHPKAIGVTGAAFPHWEGSGMQWFPEEFYWIISCVTPGFFGFDADAPVRNAWGVNMAFRREGFERVLFSEQFVGGNQGADDGTKLGLLGEDTIFSLDLSQTTQRPIIFSPEVQVFHKVHPYRVSSRYIRHRSFWEGYTKATLRRTFRMHNQVQFSMSAEYGLVRRIAVQFLPRVLSRFTRHPRVAWRQLSLAVDSLFHVALGYLSGSFPRLGAPIIRRFSK